LNHEALAVKFGPDYITTNTGKCSRRISSETDAIQDVRKVLLGEGNQAGNQAELDVAFEVERLEDSESDAESEPEEAEEPLVARSRQQQRVCQPLADTLSAHLAVLVRGVAALQCKLRRARGHPQLTSQAETLVGQRTLLLARIHTIVQALHLQVRHVGSPLPETVSSQEARQEITTASV